MNCMFISGFTLHSKNRGNVFKIIIVREKQGIWKCCKSTGNFDSSICNFFDSQENCIAMFAMKFSVFFSQELNIKKLNIKSVWDMKQLNISKVGARENCGRTGNLKIESVWDPVIYNIQ